MDVCGQFMEEGGAECSAFRLTRDEDEVDIEMCTCYVCIAFIASSSDYMPRAVCFDAEPRSDSELLQRVRLRD